MNTSHTDLRALSLDPRKRIYIGYEGRDGAGQDMALGQRSLEASSDIIVEAVGTQLEGCKHLLLCAGLGGGTGSNIAVLANILARLDIPISALASLPKDHESSIAKINAVNAINLFRNSDVASIILVDNEKILRQYRSESLTAFYSSANQAAVERLHEMNTLSTNELYMPIRGFDGEDFRRVFASRGVLIYGAADLTDDDLLIRDRLANGLRSIWDSSGLLASGFDYKDATMAGIILVAPQDLLDRAPADIFESLIRQIRELTDTSGIYAGLFQGPPDQMPRLYTMLGGLPFPNRLRTVLGQAKEEGPALGVKVARPIEELDLGELSGLDLFSAGYIGPVPAGVGGQPSPTERRPR
ncbi:MAG: Plasmid replication protein RepX [Candidatus Latescibacteria bacterium ADurb.Bin168]|nr:MAG: Plasmid replication protein RepX [Candidatus Latescibacteria bacterium ADurb.Bin168]